MNFTMGVLELLALKIVQVKGNQSWLLFLNIQILNKPIRLKIGEADGLIEMRFFYLDFVILDSEQRS